VAAYLEESGALGYPGGLPTSLLSTGQQWDFPNAWAPTTYVLVEGLRNYGQVQLAREIAEKWIRKNHTLWLNNGGRMFEKVKHSYRPCDRILFHNRVIHITG
jgi:alpha,alpha-trehalase